MCGRYTNQAEFSQIKLTFRVFSQPEHTTLPTYNISPSYGPGHEQWIILGQQASAAAAGQASGSDKGALASEREARVARWWLIPHWWNKPLASLPTAFNARAEDLAAKRMWREPFSRSRCLIPATGWREFVGSRSPKRAFHFRPVGAELFAFAGLHSQWTEPSGRQVDSFAIITTAPGTAAARIHDRMPLVLPADVHDAWLSDLESPVHLLRESQRRALDLPLEVYPSNPIANNPRFEGPETLERVPAPTDTPAKRAADKETENQLGLFSSNGTR